MKNASLALVSVVLGLAATVCRAVTPTPDELLLGRRWYDAVFCAAPASNAASLRVVYEDAPDAVTRGRSWRGTPFQIANKVYGHGVAFNSTKHLRVQLGRPAERFTADVGLENNDDTRRGAQAGNGSVTFHVLVAGQELLATPVMRLRDGPRHVNLPLGGASEFELRVKDGGDGRGWDQALWGDAAVLLKDGSAVRLQDLLPEPVNGNPYLVSFALGGAPSAALLPRWKREVRDLGAGPQGARCEVVLTDPGSGLQVRLEAQAFSDFPAVEWVAYLKNTAETNTPILENIRALDTALALPGAGGATLHWARGGVASFDDFAPQESALRPGPTVALHAGGGRSSSGTLPFFNLEGAGEGTIVAVGWSGEWAAEFGYDARGAATVKAGQAGTRFSLRPGEEIRTPRMLLLFYRGDRWRGQNLLRRFLLAHHRPTLKGQPLVAPVTCGNWGGTRAEIHLDNIRRMVEEKLPIDYYWIDAEWYGKGPWPVNVGDWTVKPELYPAGFKPLSDALRASGRELMLWFEPERVFQGTPWHRDHRDWLLDAGGDSLLYDLGNPAAREFLTQFVGDRIAEFGLGCYRQDFNMDPLPFWQKADAPDRQGIAENRHIAGLYACWDALLARFPGLIIDNCASGGRRLDLETAGRATPFWRTDGPRDPIAHQCHTWGLMAWWPLSATSQDRAGDDYEFRSSMCSSLCLNWWVSGDAPAERIPADFPFDWARKTLRQYLDIRRFYYGDYYPLTGYSQARDVWMAYQLDLPESGEGLVVALRRPQSPYDTARFPLRGLDPAATYAVTNLDTGAAEERSGRELLEKGLPVAIAAGPGSALVAYKKR